MKKFSQLALVFTLSACLVIAGCSFTSAISEINKWLPTAESAFAEIVQILHAAGAIGTTTAGKLDADGTTVSSDWADLNNAITQYQAAANSQAKASGLSDAINALEVVQKDLSTFEADVHLTNTNAQNTVQLAIGALLTTLTAFQANLTVTTTLVGGKQLKTVTLKKGGKLPNINDFKYHFNSILTNGGYARNTI